MKEILLTEKEMVFHALKFHGQQNSFSPANLFAQIGVFFLRTIKVSTPYFSKKVLLEYFIKCKLYLKN